MKNFALGTILNVLFVATLFGQASPQWLFAADAPGQHAYQLSYAVGQQRGDWLFATSELERTVAIYPDEHASVLEVISEAGAYGTAAHWRLEFSSDTLASAVLGGGASLAKVPGTAGLVYDSTVLQPTKPSAAAMDTLLALMPRLAQKQGKALVSRNGKMEWAYILNAQGWPIAQVMLQDGTLQEWLSYRYRWAENGEWDRRLLHNRLSGQQYLVERRTVETGTGQSAGWMAVQGGAAYWLLAGNGQARYWDGQSNKPVAGTWSRKNSTLSIQRADQREALAYKLKEKPWGWRVESREGQSEDWVWLTALQTVPRKLNRWREAAEAAHINVFTESGKAGLQESEGRVVLPARYDKVEPVHPHFAIVELEERLGLLQMGGTTLLPIYFEKLQYLGDSLLLAQRSGVQGILHLAGDTIVPFAHQGLIPRNDTSYWAFANGKMGLADAAGQILIKPQFDLIHPFHDTQAMAVVNGQTGVIDQTGEWVINPGAFPGLTPVGTEGYLVQTEANEWGFADRAGQLRITPEYGHLRALAPGVLIAQRAGQFGLLHRSGQSLTPLQYRMLKGCSDYSATDELCQALRAANAAAQFVSDDGFGYLDALGREHPPALPSTEAIAASYQTKVVEHGLAFTFPDAWRLEESIQKLYKQGDYGQSRVVYQFLPAEGQPLAEWAKAHVGQPLEPVTVGGQAALAYTDRERVRYYDFFKKHIYSLTGDGETIIHLEFSCKEANFLESVQHLYEIERLIELAGQD